jgi:hypothetical protein
MLENLGYEVIRAVSGTEAISILEKGRRSSFVHRHNHAGRGRRPQAQRRGGRNQAGDQSIVYLGLRREIRRSRRPVRPGVEYLREPYDHERLATVVRRVLENPERTGAGHQAPSNPLSWQINNACPAKNINPALTIDRIGSNQATSCLMQDIAASRIFQD